MSSLTSLLFIFCAALAGYPLLAVDNTPPVDLQQYQAAMSQAVTAAEKEKCNVVVGKAGWLYFVPELRTLSVGPFWGESAKTVARATNPAEADPLPAILDFKAQCDKAGVELLLMPVPAKATIYPDFFSDTIPLLEGVPVRDDIYQQQFYKLLAEKNVSVFDVTADFLLARKAGDQLYCQQDTHWNGRGCEVAAAAIYQAVKDRPWLQGKTHTKYQLKETSVKINGDLNEMLPEDKRLAQETIPLHQVEEKTADGWQPVANDRNSPVLVMGDSHTLIFQSGGDMYATGAGFAAQLANEFGFAVDVIGVRGSGATSARINLLRRNDKMAGKKLLIWCLTVREFTEATMWKNVPIIQ